MGVSVQADKREKVGKGDLTMGVKNPYLETFDLG